VVFAVRVAFADSIWASLHSGLFATLSWVSFSIWLFSRLTDGFRALHGFAASQWASLLVWLRGVFTVFAARVAFAATSWVSLIAWLLSRSHLGVR